MAAAARKPSDPKRPTTKKATPVTHTSAAGVRNKPARATAKRPARRSTPVAVPAVAAPARQYADDELLVLNLTRYAEGLLSKEAVKKKHRLPDDAWDRMGEDDRLVEAIEDLKLLRIRNGAFKREKSQALIVKAPDVLSGIMLDANANHKHRVDAIKTLDALAEPPGQAAAANQDRFIIKIDFGDGVVEHYDKPRAITTIDDEPEAKPRAITTIDDNEDGEHVP